MEDNESTDSEVDLPLASCPLCAIDEVVPETACTVPSDNSYVRWIMAQELLHYGMLPDEVVYTNIARSYNKHIHKPLKQSGVESNRWTLSMVRQHFERHVSILPRRILGKEIRRLQRYLDLADKEINAQVSTTLSELQEHPLEGSGGDDIEFIDAKSIKKVCDLQSKLLPMLEKYRQFQKEDQAHSCVATLCKGVHLPEANTQDASVLLASAAALQTSAGPGIQPLASDLFK